MNNSKVLSIIIPAYNEEKTIISILEKVVATPLVHGFAKEIVIVNDGSKDDTVALVDTFSSANPQHHIRLISHPTNKGKGAGIRTGLESVTGDIIIIQDADLEYDPHDYNIILNKFMAEPSLDIVYGSRRLGQKNQNLKNNRRKLLFNQKHPHSYTSAYIGGVLISEFTNLLTGLKLTDEPTCYKTFRNHVIQAIEIEHNSFAWEPEITVKLARLGFTFAEVPISYHPRKTNEGKKINWKDGVEALYTIFKYRFLWKVESKAKEPVLIN